MEKKGIVTKEIRRGSLAKISRKLAKNNSFIAEFEESLRGVDRKALKEKALSFI